MQLKIFDLDYNDGHFEAFSYENGFTYWWASDLMQWLGYENANTFAKAIDKAMTACNTLSIPIVENFVQVQRGKSGLDFKLSRFACFLTVMNSDPRKPAVAKAQAYFATLAGAVQDFIQESKQIERLIERGEISKHEKSLAETAHKAGVRSYAMFQDAGYLGMYNKHIYELKAIRGIEQGSLLDFMGSVELAANRFRITQTELKIQNENIKGQSSLEKTAHDVGKTVRKTMQEISGINPEDLPVQEHIDEAKKLLKEKNKQLKKIDKKKKK